MVDHNSNIENAFLRNLRCSRYDPANGRLASEEARVVEEARAFAQGLIPRFSTTSKRTMPPVVFDFADSPVVNALAWVQDGYGYIGMTWGAVCVLSDLSKRMLAHPEILPEIKGFIAETERPSINTGVFRNYDALVASRPLGTGGLVNVGPNDFVKRPAFARYLTNLALEFLILHELGHIRHGHCEYRPAAQPLIEFEAAPTTGTSATPGKLIRQALELDADAWALMQTFRRSSVTGLDEMAEGAHALGMAGDILGRCSPREALAFNWVFALQSMFFTFGYDIQLDQLAATSHPPPPQRAFNGLAIIRHVVQDPSPEAFEKVFWESYRRVFQAILRLNGRAMPENFRRVQEALMSGKLEIHLKELLKKWSEIRPDLVKLAYEHDFMP